MVKQIISRAALLLLALPAVLAATGDCVKSCETSHPVLSICDGDETGQALDDCMCQTYEGAAPMIDCIKGCPADQVNDFANNVIPDECRPALFPDVSGDGSSSKTSSGSDSQSTAPPSSTAAGQTTAGATKTAGSSPSNTSSSPSSATSTGAAVANINAEWRSPAALVAGLFGFMIL